MFFQQSAKLSRLLRVDSTAIEQMRKERRQRPIGQPFRQGVQFRSVQAAGEGG